MIVIFSGYNQRAVIAFLRCLRKNNIENYLIAAAGMEDSILKTAYKDKVFCVRKNKELNKGEIFGILEDIKSVYCKEKILIMPTTEALNRFMLEYRKELEERHITVPLVGKDLYEMISDKEQFYDVCKESSLLVPNVFEISEKFDTSYVAKPKKYQSRNGKNYSPFIVLTSQQHNDFISKYDRDDFMYQEYVVGESYYLLYYFSKEGKVYSFSQRNYAQQLNGKSILAAEPAHIHNEKIADDYIKLFQNLKFFGLVMVEVRKSEKGYYMIEANPRFWGPSQLFVDAGVRFFERFLNDYDNYKTIINDIDCGNIINDNNDYKNVTDDSIDYNVKYLWSGGCREELTKTQDDIWLSGGKENVYGRIEEFKLYDIYDREDTIDIFRENNPDVR